MRVAAAFFTACCLVLSALPAVAAEPAEGGAKKGKQTAHKFTQSQTYLELEPINASFMENGRPAGLLMVWIGIDVPDAKLRGEAAHALPVIRDAFVRNMMSFASTAVRSTRQPDVIMISDRLQAVTDRALGRKGARILLRQVAVRVQPVSLR